MPTNDNADAASAPPSPAADPDGHAALVLVESLIHGLVERSVLSVADAIEIIDTAVEVQADVAEAADGAGAPMWRSHALLTAMATSLRSDMEPGISRDGKDGFDGIDGG